MRAIREVARSTTERAPCSAVDTSEGPGFPLGAVLFGSVKRFSVDPYSQDRTLSTVNRTSLPIGKGLIIHGESRPLAGWKKTPHPR